MASWWLVLTKESRTVAEEESLRQNMLLQQEIEDHRRTDKALQKAKEAADTANLAKSRFLASMSHELRTPLNSIIGYAQILQKDPAIPAHRRDAVDTIRQGGEHLMTLIDESLDIALIEAGKFKLRRIDTDFADFLAQITKMFRIAAERQGIAFNIQVHDRLPRVVRMDQQRVRQILINLIGNAVKFTSQGEVVVHIHYAGEIARFHIADSGPGISAEDMERIFHPFQRAQNTPHTDDSTGLGLTISRMITERMGGELTVESTIGHGSTFKLRLFLPEVRGARLATRPQEALLPWTQDAAPEARRPEEHPAIPPVQHLLAIRELARIGYIKGIGEEIERIHSLDPLYGNYLLRLRDLAKQFRTAEIVQLIEETLRRESTETPA